MIYVDADGEIRHSMLEAIPPGGVAANPDGTQAKPDSGNAVKPAPESGISEIEKSLATFTLPK